jgi:hypothetical protein
MSQEDPLEVNILRDADYLVVRNNFIGETNHVKIGNDLYRKPESSRGSGIGLQNIRNRYRILCSKPVKIQKDDFFTVSIPLIHSYE